MCLGQRLLGRVGGAFCSLHYVFSFLFAEFGGRVYLGRRGQAVLRRGSFLVKTFWCPRNSLLSSSGRSRRAARCVCALNDVQFLRRRYDRYLLLLFLLLFFSSVLSAPPPIRFALKVFSSLIHVGYARRRMDLRVLAHLPVYVLSLPGRILCMLRTSYATSVSPLAPIYV
ncbi:hypothetical protein C8F04DRAFT_1142618 [Mycena alexandri]|uniref:Transmembrane protein n=1 Tax=Mycena alexandri TaxID=1745969 RepID=A0AAD6S817_9AGAR|nr:hypothetical protein C8F04DRAFT_1142618 [Mycena alexandri]